MFSADTLFSGAATLFAGAVAFSGGADTLFAGGEFSAGGVEAFSGGAEAFSRGAEAFSGGVEAFSGGVEAFSGGVTTGALFAGDTFAEGIVLVTSAEFTILASLICDISFVPTDSVVDISISVSDLFFQEYSDNIRPQAPRSFNMLQLFIANPTINGLAERFIIVKDYVGTNLGKPRRLQELCRYSGNNMVRINMDGIKGSLLHGFHNADCITKMKGDPISEMRIQIINHLRGIAPININTGNLQTRVGNQ
jgi:hypothetical protein